MLPKLLFQKPAHKEQGVQQILRTQESITLQKWMRPKPPRLFQQIASLLFDDGQLLTELEPFDVPLVSGGV